MFTGIVKYVGKVQSVKPSEAQQGARRLVIDAGPITEGLALGHSVAVNGSCLTASEIQGQAVGFDVVAETLSLTTLGGLVAGARVNLEPALKLNSGVDGHLVQGHVDGRATLAEIRRGREHVMVFTAARELTDQMVLKGSVAINGVSLTLTEATDGRFAVALIPTTLEETTLGELSAGDRVNIETDLIGKYVQKFLGKQSGGGVTLDKLRDAGF